MNNDYCYELENQVEKQEELISSLQMKVEEQEKEIEYSIATNSMLTNKLETKRSRQKEKQLKLVPLYVIGFWVIAIIVSLVF